MRMTNEDVRELLKKVASDAPDARTIVSAELRRRIAIRRRAVTAGTVIGAGVGLAGLVAGAATLASAGDVPSGGDSVGSAVQSVEQSTGSRPASLPCGSTDMYPPAAGPMKLASAIPVRLVANARGLAQARVTLVNVSNRSIQGATAAAPTAYLVKGGSTVAKSADIPASEQVVNLGPGQSRDFLMAIDLSSCKARVHPGHYHIYATLDFYYEKSDGMKTGESMQVVGGPWVAMLS